jgi:hypothetical protein
MPPAKQPSNCRVIRAKEKIPNSSDERSFVSEIVERMPKDRPTTTESVVLAVPKSARLSLIKCIFEIGYSLSLLAGLGLNLKHHAIEVLRFSRPFLKTIA